MKPCPCGTKKPYLECCYIFISGKAPAPTPETLMRSRYTAYTEANIDYIEATMKGRALAAFDNATARNWALNAQWQGLEIIRTTSKNNKGFVEFIARYQQNGKDERMHEISEFRFDNEKWFYVDGVRN